MLILPLHPDIKKYLKLMRPLQNSISSRNRTVSCEPRTDDEGVLEQSTPRRTDEGVAETVRLQQIGSFVMVSISLETKFNKQKKFFENNIFHPSLKTELLEPKEMRIWSFRIDRKYRAIFIFHKRDEVEIIDVNNHYS